MKNETNDTIAGIFILIGLLMIDIVGFYINWKLGLFELGGIFVFWGFSIAYANKNNL